MFSEFENKVTIVDNNFLTLEECLLIKNKIFSVQQLWQRSKIKYFNFLPYGMYSIPYDVYKSNVVIYKPIMLKLFSEFYEKIKFKLKEIFKVDIEYNDYANYPGFHISNEHEMKVPSFHIDKFNGLGSILKEKEKLYLDKYKIFSFIIPISIPKEGAGLLIRNKFVGDKTKLEYDSVLDYQPGMLAMWDGNVQHSIKPFKPLNKNDLRITWQFHAAVFNNNGYIFW